MRIVRSFTGLAAADRGAVVAMGNFDGVHLGHQSLIAAAGAIARQAGRPLAVMAFEPHPRRFFQPDGPPFRLTSPAGRARALAGLGVELLYELTFDSPFAARTAQEFVQTVLVDGVGVAHLVTGYNLRFGKARGGDVRLLARLAAVHGFGHSAVDAVTDSADQPYSSSRVRDCVRAGDMAGAAALLGRPWEVEGEVIAGQRLGRTLGYPTANINLGEYCPPRHGIYGVRLAPGEAGDGLSDHGVGWLDGVASFGTRPTVKGDHELLEVHLLGRTLDLYGRTVRVRWYDFIRPEEAFADLETLREAIGRDCQSAARLLAAWPVEP
ncbi:MAG: bifunctional riboflavin kinase/FAD synthetase [Alphaproteobacteria bacterium]